MVQFTVYTDAHPVIFTLYEWGMEFAKIEANYYADEHLARRIEQAKIYVAMKIGYAQVPSSSIANELQAALCFLSVNGFKELRLSDIDMEGDHTELLWDLYLSTVMIET